MDVCISKKGSSDKGHWIMMIYDAGLPFEILQTDIWDLFSISSLDNKYLLTVEWTKWVEAFPYSYNKNIQPKSDEKKDSEKDFRGF